MSKVAHYLQEHLLGEALTTADIRRHFSVDGSVFTVTPSIVMYPQDENDVRKATRFTWQLAERGRVIPITARGMGTDTSGAAIGSGIIMVFPAHMNRILELDSKTGTVMVEPGILFGKLQQTLYTHGRFLPPYPASLEYSTIGGAVANNKSGVKSAKYGSMRKYTKALRVVLANGEVIETRRLTKRELSKKLGLATFEGEVYRSLDTLIEENHELLQKLSRNVSKNSAGYALADVKHKDGSFDLTPLIVGSQGTLGIVTEATLTTELYNPSTTLVAAYLDDIHLAEEIISELRKFSDVPSSIEVVDEQLLTFIDKVNPNQLKGIVDKPYPKLIMFIEFDDLSQRNQKRMAKKTEKLLKHYQVNYQTETDEAAQEKLWKIRQSATAVTTYAESNVRPLPIIEDGVVPIDKFNEYLEGLYGLIGKFNLTTGVWGHAGEANLRAEPLLDLSQVGDRQKLFKVMSEYYQMVIGLGGTTTSGHGDGRLRGPFLAALYGAEVYAVLQKAKQVFDPYGTLNPGVKINVSLDDVKPLLRSEYSVDRQYHHLPRS